MAERYAAPALKRFGAALFAAAGMPAERAEVVGDRLVEADLMGHDTHGLNLAPGYLGALERGVMAKAGEPLVLADRGPALQLDGGYLSGVWLVHHATVLAVARARQFGLCAVSLRRSHHIGCLAPHVEQAALQGFLMQLATSDPSNKGVAPYGSHQPLFTPDPIAFGIPTETDPILVDISASTTTLGLTRRFAARGERLPGKWLIDNQGQATDDPAALRGQPPGAILPLGGLESGHKGFGLALVVEALTSGLGGHGRKDVPTTRGASVFLQVIDPAAFGGLDSFRAETSWLAQACRRAKVAAGRPPVRLPGDGARASRSRALAEGVVLYSSIMPDLKPWAAKLGVAMPQSI